ncbi:uncharacterized protein LOC134439923 [Engraulis encrasicolus]|uniref:uncharacterized protein LOC134439923 n=1 Tax=Engraulis encrasicolus TaxID=184585 RepID=UPI002FD5EBC9
MGSVICILLFFLGLVTKTTLQADTIHAARIFGSSHVNFGDTKDIKCSAFGYKKPEERVYVYLCKNGAGIDSMETECPDSIFLIRNAKKEDSGNYSCMFSRTKYHPKDVKGQGENAIFLQVIDRVYPAVIAGNGSEVKPDADVDFTCISKDAPDTPVLLAYLCLNEIIIRVEMWDSRRKEAVFRQRRVRESDTGNYSCVVSARPLNTTELNMCGNNSVSLRVSGNHSTESPPGVTSSSTEVALAPLFLLPSLVLLLLLMILLWKNGKCTCKRSWTNMPDDSVYEEVMVYDTNGQDQVTPR